MPNRLFAAPNFTIKLIPNIFRRGHHKGFIIGGVKGASINRHARMCACLTAQKINWRMIPWRTVSVHNEMDVPCGELHRQHTRTTQRNAVFDAFYPFDKFTPKWWLEKFSTTFTYQLVKLWQPITDRKPVYIFAFNLESTGAGLCVIKCFFQWVP